MITYFLHSVGTAIEPDTCETWPIKIDGTVDRDEFAQVHLSEICDEWWDQLGKSAKDLEVVKSCALSSFRLG